jgi:hypothetical protein
MRAVVVGSGAIENGQENSVEAPATEGKIRFFQFGAFVPNGAISDLPRDFRLVSWPAE